MFAACAFIVGCGGGIRTHDFQAHEAGELPLLYPAIYKGSFQTLPRSVKMKGNEKQAFILPLAVPTGFEPATSDVTDQRSHR